MSEAHCRWYVALAQTAHEERGDALAALPRLPDEVAGNDRLARLGVETGRPELLSECGRQLLAHAEVLQELARAGVALGRLRGGAAGEVGERAERDARLSGADRQLADAARAQATADEAVALYEAKGNVVAASRVKADGRTRSAY